MFGDGTNRKSMAYVQNVADFLVYCLSRKGYHLHNYVDKPDLDMNTLVEIARKTLLSKNNVGFRLPAWTGLLIGNLFDFLSFTLGRKLPVSSIRMRKFLATTAFNTSILASDFKAKITLEEGLKRTLKHEFGSN